MIFCESQSRTKASQRHELSYVDRRKRLRHESQRGVVRSDAKV